MKKIVFLAVMTACLASVSAQTVSIQSIQAVQISLSAPSGSVYELQGSTNIADSNAWTDLGIQFSDNGNGLYTATNFPQTPNLFYRSELIGSAAVSASVSLDASSPLPQTIEVYDITDGQTLGLPVIVFDVSAQGGDVHLHGVTAQISVSGQGSVTAAYLYQGSVPITSASVIPTSVPGYYTATFGSIPDGTAGATIPINTTVPFTVKVDVNGVYTNGVILSVAVDSGNVSLEDQDDKSVNVTGTAPGNPIAVEPPGPLFNNYEPPAITKEENSDQFGNMMATYTATFQVSVTAVGESITFGLPTSPEPAFGSSDTNTVVVYKNGAPDNLTNYSVSVQYQAPINTTLSSDGQAFVVGVWQSTIINVTYSFSVENPGDDIYAIGIAGIRWSAGGATTVTPEAGPAWQTPFE